MLSQDGTAGNAFYTNNKETRYYYICNKLQNGCKLFSNNKKRRTEQIYQASKGAKK